MNRQGHTVSQRRQQQGAAAVEFIVIFILFAAFITGLFEMTRVFRAKHTLNNATFMAARMGSVHNASLDPMNVELANGMVEHFMRGGRTPQEYATALLRAQGFGMALAAFSVGGVNGGVIIVSPTQAIFDDLSKPQWVRLTGEEDYAIQNVIPNDNLRWRPRDTASIDGGEINLQDANLLKIRSVWCHRLVVPALDRLIYAIVNNDLWSLGNLQPFSQRQAVCNAMTQAAQAGTAGFENVTPGFYLAISGKAVLRMQSAIIDNDLS